MTNLSFTKMHGIGNDYIYINIFDQQVENPSELAVKLSDRHFGIGSDGLVLIGPSDQADFRMDMYNLDGSRGKMCGNAIRCVGKYVYERQMTNKKKISIETLSGIKTLNLLTEKGQVNRVKVDMGLPVLDPRKIPVRWRDDRLINEPISIGGTLYRITSVSMGNPHAVVFHDNIDQLDLSLIGPAFEQHTLFPDKVNTEFVQVIDKDNLRMRVWETGSGETMACGTGACAALVASVLNGYSRRKAVLHLKGGQLMIEWPADDEPVMMSGPAAFVFDGIVSL